MPTAGAVLRIARGELGRHENPPGSNHTKFGKDYGLDPAPWCAEFACSWVWRQAGLPVPSDAQSRKGWASVGFFFGAAGKHGWVVDGGRRAAIRPGDYVCFEWASDADTWPDHVGIVAATHPDGTFTTIEGNSPGPHGFDEVAFHVRPRDQVAGFVRPPYDGGEDAPPPIPRTSPPEPHMRTPYPKLPSGVILRRDSPYHDEVAIYQRRMRRRGWGAIGPIDGDFGPSAEGVTRQFQGEKGLEVDGEVGPQTWKAAFELPVT